MTWQQSTMTSSACRKEDSIAAIHMSGTTGERENARGLSVKPNGFDTSTGTHVRILSHFLGNHSLLLHVFCSSRPPLPRCRTRRRDQRIGRREIPRSSFWCCRRLKKRRRRKQRKEGNTEADLVFNSFCCRVCERGRNRNKPHPHSLRSFASYTSSISWNWIKG